MINIDSMVEHHNLQSATGYTIDSFFCCLILNIMHIPRQFFNAIDMTTKNPLLWAILANDATCILDMSSDQRLIAEFAPNADCPFYRLYSYRYDGPQFVAKEALVAYVDRTSSNISLEDMYVKYTNHTEVTLSQAWVTKLQQAFAPSNLIAEGRIENTTVKKTIIVARKNSGCVLCGMPAMGYVSSTVGYPKSILYIAHTCQIHQETAKKSPTILHFIMALFSINVDVGQLIKSSTIPQEVMTLLENTLCDELEVALIRKATNRDQTTLTFQRSSGFQIILRLKALMNYAYMINTPNGTPYRRIDAAPDHLNIPFFPDHIHLAPKKDNAKVISSYTYGFPLLDFPLIKRLLHEGERDLQNG